MRPMTRDELAAKIGVDVRTLRRWISDYRKELEKRGVRPFKLLPPKAIRWLIKEKKLDIPP